MSREMTDAQYGQSWEAAGPLQITLVGKPGKCKHGVGDSVYDATPCAEPEGVCTALLHVLDLYTWRTALGFPSWEADDRDVFRIHCGTKKGTLWELRKRDMQAST